MCSSREFFPRPIAAAFWCTWSSRQVYPSLTR